MSCEFNLIISASNSSYPLRSSANFMGMILRPKSKHSISLSVAKEISKVAREFGAKPVGVFVDDDLDTILRASDASDLEFLQVYIFYQSLINNYLLVCSFMEMLLGQLFQSWCNKRVIYVLHANQEGDLQNQISDEDCSLVDWILVDSATGGR